MSNDTSRIDLLLALRTMCEGNNRARNRAKLLRVDPSQKFQYAGTDQRNKRSNQ